MGRGKARSSSPAPSRSAPQQHHQQHHSPAPAPAAHHSSAPMPQQSGGGFGSGLGGALATGAAIGAGSAAGRMAIEGMMGGGSGHHAGHPQQQAGEYGNPAYGQEEQMGTNWLLWGGLGVASAAGAYYLMSRPQQAARAAFLPVFAAPATTTHKWRRTTDE